jgi:hypothetical protein
MDVRVAGIIELDHKIHDMELKFANSYKHCSGMVISMITTSLSGESSFKLSLFLCT